MPIDTLEDIIAWPEYQLFVSRNSINEVHFSKSMHFPEKHLWEKTMKDNPNAFVTTSNEAEQRLLNGKNQVYFGSLASVRREFKNFPGGIIASRRAYRKSTQAMVFRKNFSYLNIFDHEVVKMLEHGIIDNIVNGERRIQWGRSMDEYAHSDLHNETIPPIGYQSVLTIFSLAGAGALLAIIVSGIEMINHKATCH